MRKGWKAYLSVALCLVLFGSNSSFVYAAQVEETYTEEVEIAEEASAAEETESVEVTEDTEITEELVETEEEELAEEELEEVVEVIEEEELTEASAEEEPVSADTKKLQRTADGNPIVAEEMPAAEMLPEVVLGETYSVEYDKHAPHDRSIWMKLTPETAGIYRIITNAKSGSEQFWNTDATDVDTDYTYAEDGLFQYLEAGTTYVVKMNGEYYGNGVLEFSIVKAKEVSALKVTKAPDKSTYYNNFGEYIEVKGMKIKVSYTDGTSETVTITDSSWVELESGYTLELDEYGKTVDICINGFEAFPSIQYKVKFVDATGLTKYTSGNKITFADDEAVKYFTFVPGFSGEVKLEAIGKTNVYAELFDSANGNDADTVTKGKTYHLRVSNYGKSAGTARVYLTKAAAQRKITSIQITKQPYQTVFYYDDTYYFEVHLGGMEVTVSYGDGTKEVVQFGDRSSVKIDNDSRWLQVDNTIISPEEGDYTLVVSADDSDKTAACTVSVKPYPETPELTIQEGETITTVEPGKAYYKAYVIPEDGVYRIEHTMKGHYEYYYDVIAPGDEFYRADGTREYTKDTVVYFYMLNYGSANCESIINVYRVSDIGAEYVDFEWITKPQDEALASYGLVRGEGTITFSDGSKTLAGIVPYQYVVDKDVYPVTIEAEVSDGKDYDILGEREVTYTAYIEVEDETIYTEVDKSTVEFVGPSTYNGGPKATIKKNQVVNVNAAEIDDDYVVYKFVPVNTAAYRMMTVGETGYSTGHEYTIFTESDGRVNYIDSTNASGYYTDREVLTAGETYYVVFPLSSSDEFSFVCRENKAVKGISGYFSNELQLKNATVADVLKNAVITVYFKDGTSEKLDNSKWTYYSDAEGTGYYNTDSYYNVYTVNLGKTQGKTKKLTSERQMISVYQQMNYVYEVPLGYVKANGYKITFNKNNGTNLSQASRMVASGNKLGTLPTVKRKGYVLKGWYTAKTGGTKFTAATKISKSRTLYAQWTKVTKPAQVKKPTLTNLSGKKMKVAYKKVTNAKGYQIVSITSSKFTASTTKKTTTTALTKTFTGLKKGKTYYVKVRAYKTDSFGNKIYGAYSVVNKIKITK